jgi:superfamily II DNA/RNA helicase
MKSDGWQSADVARSSLRPSWPHYSNGAPQISAFLDLGVTAHVARRIESLGITTPLPIQVATIPEALAGRDICGQAPTGSGKTLAFAAPLVSRVHSSAPRRPGALVLVPTRELAEQVRRVIASLMGDKADRVVAVYGGTSYGPQRHALRRGVDIVVACPGRLEDLVAQGDIQLGDVRTVVLDEADRMADMGFVRPVCRLLDQTAKGRQVLLFSATMGKEVNGIVDKYLRDPARCNVSTEPEAEADVTHHFWRTARADRVGVTAELIARHGQAFVFCRTKRGADRVASQLRSAGVDAAPIHGDRSQPQRERALAAFANRGTSALVATDVVARGIHVEDVPCVVHFDLAGDPESYVHRSGRTGRTGKSGAVVSLVPDELHGEARSLQRALGLPLEVTAPFAEGPAAPPPAPRLTGSVKFFDSRRGYGFLTASGGAEVYVHKSKIRASRTGPALRKGEVVTFELAAGRAGEEAHDVVPAAGQLARVASR